MNTREIAIESGARVAIDTLPSDAGGSDRIADDVSIRMSGGELGAYPTNWGMNTTEHVGTVILDHGSSSVHGTHYFSNSLQSHADLEVGTIVRNPGTILTLIPSNGRSDTPFTRDAGPPGIDDLVLDNPPPVVNGLLPAWLNDGTVFTTLGPGGRATSVDNPTIGFDGSDQTSNVRPNGATVLDRDRTINSLYGLANSAPIDLGGHTLTVGSGGMSGATVSNGTIRPGDHSNGELVFLGSTNMAPTLPTMVPQLL